MMSRSVVTIRVPLWPTSALVATMSRRPPGARASLPTMRRVLSTNSGPRSRKRPVATSQNPPHKRYGEKRQHINDAVPGSALGLGEVSVAQLVRDADGRDGHNSSCVWSSEDCQESREHPTHDEVLGEPERADPRW